MAISHASGAAAVVVVADSRAAAFYRQSRRFSTPDPVSTLHAEEVEGAVPAQPSDQPGKSFDSYGSGRHKMEPGVTLRDEAAAHFAHAIVGRLNELAGGGEVAGLIVIAAPRLLGMLRNEMDRSALHALERLEIAKDVIGADAAEIGRLISDQGGLPRLS